ncbi:uL13 family ribosomal protein [Candidatus Vidania fulgoroideae]|uniref:UL13 family ribosomal protein n=1 Tax=Candidatus Vidania fulgoroideorum TaxID=881286 RepID=A0A974X786_9PROT|nr:uL13 family ribosomal protein [Candidatus Vidania fulgoroideae]
MIIDLKDKVLGRCISANIMFIKRGIVSSVVNCANFCVSNLESKKSHYFYSGFPGGFVSLTNKFLMLKNPILLVRLCIKRMLPTGRLFAAILSHIKFYLNDFR